MFMTTNPNQYGLVGQKVNKASSAKYLNEAYEACIPEAMIKVSLDKIVKAYGNSATIESGLETIEEAMYR